MQQSVNYRAHAVGIVLAIGAAAYLFNAPDTHSVQPKDAQIVAMKAAIREVDSATAKQLIDAGAAVIDVRGKEAFADGHIAGAKSIPLAELSRAVPADLDRTKPVVIYCGDGSTTGPDGTRAMNAAGFDGAVNLKGGMEGWRKEGRPVANGLS